MRCIRPLYFSIFSLILLAVASLLYPLSHDSLLSAQEINNSKGTTNGRSLDVLLEPIPYPAKVDLSPMKFKVSFLKPNTTQLQEHIDFNLRISKNGKPLFQATNQTGQPLVPLHATYGYMTIPMINYEFNQTGKYIVEIPVYGIVFNPIRPEFVNFTIDVLS